MQSVNIQVTPTMTDHGLECDITGTNVTDDAICLSKGAAHEITFNVANGWAWDTANPFASRPGKCPPPGATHGPLTATDMDANSFKVRVPAGNKRIFHYRLNFANGETYDPIIIRD